MYTYVVLTRDTGPVRMKVVTKRAEVLPLVGERYVINKEFVTGVSLENFPENSALVLKAAHQSKTDILPRWTIP